MRRPGTIPPLSGGLEPLVMAVVAAGFGIAVVVYAAHSAPVYLSPDGAHAITDARALLGAAPRTFTYLPAWPALLVPALVAGIDPVLSVDVGLAAGCALLFGGLYVLARTAGGPRAALVGAAVGSTSSAIAELLGWQGGATLVATAALAWTLALFDRWLAAGRLRYGVATGVGYVAMLAAHPFVAAVGTALLAVRWAADAVHRRSFCVSGRGPMSLTGLATAAVLPVLAGLLLLPRYLAIDAPTGSGLRSPDLGASLAVVAWLARETPVTTLVLLAAAAAGLSAPRSTRAVVAGVLAVAVLVPAMLSGDASYQSRVAYLLPIPLALGGAVAFGALDARLWRPPLPGVSGGRLLLQLGPIVVGLFVATLTMPNRLAAAVPFYSPLGADDNAVLHTLTTGEGTIATSWSRNEYWGGMANSWLVEGLTNRAAIGPSDPALSTRQSERQESTAAWQLFAGEQGIENGALQLAFGPAGWRADPAIAARLFGYYIPLVFVSDLANDYGPADQQASVRPIAWRLAGGSATGVRIDAAGRPTLIATVQLDGRQAHVRLVRPAGVGPTTWSLWIWPAYGLPWRQVTVGDSSVEIHPDGGAAYRDATAWAALDPAVTISVEDSASLRYVPADPRYRLQAIMIGSGRDGSVAFTVTVPEAAQPGPVTGFTESSLLERWGVRAAVVWRDTGWLERFATSRCFRPAAAGQRLATFVVAPGCLPA